MNFRRPIAWSQERNQRDVDEIFLNNVLTHVKLRGGFLERNDVVRKKGSERRIDLSICNQSLAFVRVFMLFF